jgi:hypothetical protein
MARQHLTPACVAVFALALAAPSRAGAEGGRPAGPPRSGGGRPPALRTSSGAAPRGALAPSVEADSPDCGANSLYVFLRLHNVGCSLADVRDEVRVTDHGASMRELKEAAGRHGLDAVVLSASPAELFTRLPAIARLSATGGEDRGHYVVVTRADENGVQLIDGTTGRLNQVARAAFEREFSGYALARRGRKPGAAFGVVNVCLLGLGAAQAGALVLLGLRGLAARRA